MSDTDTLEARVKELENQVSIFKDIEAIRRLQKSFGYYIEHLMVDEITELFADDGQFQWVGWGTFKGKEKIKSVWSKMRNDNPPAYIYLAMQLSDIIDVAPDGKTAKGRWYCLGGNGSRTTDDKGQTTKGSFWTGVYENQYVKLDGVWKIKVMQYGLLFYVNGVDEVLTKEQAAASNRTYEEYMRAFGFDIRDLPEAKTYLYTGYIRPFHFKHPVTGNKSGEAAWNTAITKPESSYFSA